MSLDRLFAQEELAAEYWARESYLEELRAEHFDPCWNVDPDDDEPPADWVPSAAIDEDIPF